MSKANAKRTTPRPRTGHPQSRVPTADPMFAAIEAHKAAVVASSAAHEGLRQLEERTDAELQWRDPPAVVVAQRTFRSIAEIQAFAAQSFTPGLARIFLGNRAANETQRLHDRLHRRLMQAWNQAKREHDRKRAQAGLTAAQERHDAAEALEVSLLYRLCHTNPTTPEGLKAMLAHLRDHVGDKVDAADRYGATAGLWGQLERHVARFTVQRQKAVRP